jgi:hypothetical protein
MKTTMNQIRKTLRNRWALGALALVALTGIVYLVWGEMGLAGLGGCAAAFVLFLLTGGFGDPKPYTDEDHEEQSRRWKWDGSNNDDGLSN